MIETLLTITVFLGIWYVFLLLIPLWIALLMASFLTILHLFARRIIFHDIFYLLGSVGVAINLGAWLPAEILVVGLVGFTIYDMVAEPPGGPIERLAVLLVRWHIIPGFILPQRLQNLGDSVDKAKQPDALLLGAGDVIVPLTLVAREALTNLPGALLILFGTLVGSIALIHRKDLHPRGALAPLAVGAALPFIFLHFILKV